MKNVQNVFVFGSGTSSGVGMVHNVENHMYCSGRKACSKFTITNIRGDLYAFGEQVMQYSTISNVFGSLVSIGYQAMIDATIQNVTNVCDSVYPLYMVPLYFCDFKLLGLSHFVFVVVFCNSYCVMENILALLPQ